MKYLVPGKGGRLWVDGFDAAIGAIVDTRYVADPATSPFVDGSRVPMLVRRKVLNDALNDFRRYAAIIADPEVPFVSLRVITNEAAAVPYFQRLMDLFRIPGDVRAVETQVGKPR